MNLHDELKGMIESREMIERMYVSGPLEKSNEVMDILHNDGWRLTRSGLDTRARKKWSGDRFLFIAERALADPAPPEQRRGG
jgi:hypothetical protein